MLIDWFTVLAQIVNFLILVWLMKRFLYKPVLHAINEREKKVADQLDEAAKKKSEADLEMQEFKKKNEAFDSQRAALLDKAKADANAEGDKLLAETKREIGLVRAKQIETLNADSHNLANSIILRTQKEVFAIVRKVLVDLSGATLEERVIDVFVRRLREMDAASKANFASAMESAPNSAVLKSAFDLSSDERGSIQKALNDYFSADVSLKFETSNELVGGIEFTTNGLKVAWSISDYLSAMTKSIDKLIEQQTQAKTKPAVETATKSVKKDSNVNSVPVKPKVATDAEPSPDKPAPTSSPAPAPKTPSLTATAAGETTNE
jgi:F-type H+-transporting ATPase subunit b